MQVEVRVAADVVIVTIGFVVDEATPVRARAMVPGSVDTADAARDWTLGVREGVTAIQVP